MAQKVFHQLFNVGIVDTDKQHRVDLDRLRLAAADQTNILCDVVGKGFVRPGTEYLANNKSNGQARLLPFIAGPAAAFQLELTDRCLRVRDGANDQLVTRPNVTAAVTNGDFSSATGWTLSTEAGQTSAISGGFLLLSARGKGAHAYGYRAVTINQVGTEHALRIVVARGPVNFKLGSSVGAVDIIPETVLRTGTHSFAFTPSVATVYPVILTDSPTQRIVDSITIEAAGVMELPTNWLLADLGLIRLDQSIDVMYLAARGYKQQRIERHADHSWSVCDYDSNDGPFLVGRSADIKLTPSVLEGNGTLTASSSFFNANHVGALFMLGHEGIRLDTYLAGASKFTDTIEVTGVNETSYNDRDFTFTLAGTWVGTARVQRSFDSDVTGFQAFRREQASATIDITANATYIDDDNEDNAITWYRIGFEAGTYTSGELHLTAQYGGGNGFGICRVTGFTNDTTVSIEVLRPFVGLTATTDWREGAWSANQGWPSAVHFAEGRLVWAGDDKVWASASDSFDTFDETIVGDSAPLLRSIGIGGRNRPQWLLNLSSLIVGTDSRVVTVRANSIDDTLTPTNFKIVPLSKVGSPDNAPAVELADSRALFVQSAGRTVYELSYQPYPVNSYTATPFSKLTTEIFADGILEMAPSLIPDQRIWITTNGGDAVCIVYEAAEKVAAFIPIATRAGDVIESVCVLPGDEQERVYFSVKRTVNGSVVRFTEKLALDREAAPYTVCKVMDSMVTGTGGHSATIDVAHLKGATVVAWVDGAPVETSTGVPQEFVVSAGGQITLPVAPTEGWAVGLAYPWVFESSRLEYGVPNSTPVGTVKSVAGLSLLIGDVVRSGVLFRTRNADGQLSAVSRLNTLVRGKVPDNVTLGRALDEGLYAVPGVASLDQRLVVQGSSPYPCSLLAMVLAIETYGG